MVFRNMALAPTDERQLRFDQRQLNEFVDTLRRGNGMSLPIRKGTTILSNEKEPRTFASLGVLAEASGSRVAASEANSAAGRKGCLTERQLLTPQSGNYRFTCGVGAMLSGEEPKRPEWPPEGLRGKRITLVENAPVIGFSGRRHRARGG